MALELQELKLSFQRELSFQIQQASPGSVLLLDEFTQ